MAIIRADVVLIEEPNWLQRERERKKEKENKLVT